MLEYFKDSQIYLYECQLTCLDQCNCAFKLERKDEHKSLLQLRHDFYGGSKVDNTFKRFQFYNGIMKMSSGRM